MAGLAQAGVSPIDAKKLTLWEYTAIVGKISEWNKSDDFDPQSPPDPDLIEFMKAHE